MNKIRVIARIDVKNEFAIKGIHFDGLRKIGNPNNLAIDYYKQGIDEILFLDAVAAYYDRNSLSEIIKKACKDVFVPITVGGGIRTIKDIQSSLNAGADKVAINTQAVRNPDFIKKASKVFGSQCIVSSIVAKNIGELKWEVYTDNGREPTGIDVAYWAKKVESLGAGEILLTSIDQDGTKRGFDLNLNKVIADIVNIPLISSSGAGTEKDIVDLLKFANTDAVSVSSILHYNLSSVRLIKSICKKNLFEVRF